MIQRTSLVIGSGLVLLGLFTSFGFGQSAPAGVVRGRVTLESSEKPVHGALVTILQLRRSVVTDDDGIYRFEEVPPGTYEIVARLDRMPDVVESVTVAAGAVAERPFHMTIVVRGTQLTVTATGSEETSLRAIQPVVTLDATELAERNPVSLGEALDGQVGIAKRSSGPGTSRPVVRGFDGDRVLVLQDGDRIGALGSQSADHAEPIDVLALDKIEVVKGPATLLHGSNAIGGVVNAITGHESAHPGARGYLTALAVSNNDLGGGSAGVEHGIGKWRLWGSGGGQRAGDYRTPLGRIGNSFARSANATGGIGYYPGKAFLSVDYTLDDRRYGVPFDPTEEDPEIVFLDPRRDSIRLNAGVRERGGRVDAAQLSLRYNDYRHAEIDRFSRAVHTSFENRTFNYRAVVDQRRTGPWSASYGIWGLRRDYSAVGEEALAPPTVQNAVAVFGVGKLDFERVTVQLGARFEHNDYTPAALPNRALPARAFDGVSGAAGVRVALWRDGAFAANYNHSYRAPALEELYNLGPHRGNATFEIGDPLLERERGDGFDLSLRHGSRRLRAEANYFRYDLRDFIYLAPTGEIEDGLIEANYAQGRSRYSGAEGKLELTAHPNATVIAKLDYVRAGLTRSDTPLPRIPPLRVAVGVQGYVRGFRVYPELLFAGRQDRLFPTETATAGYALANVTGSYTIVRRHAAHTLSVGVFNLGDALVRNHLSFIKSFAPEFGRGVRFTYTVRLF